MLREQWRQEGEAEQAGRKAAYEAPRLTPMGNLHDLLAGNFSKPCDSVDVATAEVEDPGSCGV